MKIYCIKDNVPNVYNDPFLAQNDGEAIRMFAFAAQSKESRVWQFAKDMDLYCLGEYDTKTGIIKPEVTFVTNALQYKMTADWKEENERNNT